MNKIEFKKYGNGSSTYEVFLMTSYNEIAKRASYTTVGFVERVGNVWVAMDGIELTATSRKELANKLVELYLTNNK